MKQKWYRLCNRHRWVPVVVVTALMAILLSIYSLGDFDSLNVFIYILAGFTVLLSFFLGASCGGHLMNPTVKTLHDHCDPYPLLEECDTQLSYVKNRGNRQLISVNRAAALIELGRTEEALAALEDLNIDSPTAMPLWRYIYYHNSAMAALRCDQREKAEIYTHKAEQQVSSISEKRWQSLLQYSAQGRNTALCLYDGDYEGARRVLEEKWEHPDRLAQVHHAYQWAQVELAQGNLSSAQIQLEFVLQHGNRLAIVEKARTLLEEINAQA